jgi:SAM-dependent methyltransferase
MASESTHAASDREKFDAYAQKYTDVLKTNVAITGEDPEYFSIYKLRCLERLVPPGYDEPVLDYGCGTGTVTRHLCTRFSRVSGFDPSEQSVVAARIAAPAARISTALDDVADGTQGLVVLSGVLHHILPRERPEVIERAKQKLQAGGRLVVFEHNPLNPLTRHAVATCPFDDDAILLWPWQARRLLVDAGLGGVTLRFIVFLPRALARLRWIEPRLGALPLGAQVMVVGVRP